jgi:hypothetical protein
MPIPTGVMLAELTLASISDKISKFRGVLLQDLGNLMSDGRYSPEYRQELMGALFAAARLSLDGIGREAEQGRETVRAWIDEASTAPAMDPARELADITKQREAWRRAESQLRHGVNVAEIVEEAVKRRDLATLTALRIELPIFERTTSGPATIGMAAALTRLESALAELLPGDAGIAERHRLKLDRQWKEIETALRSGRDHLAALESDPAGRLRRAARLADVEQNSSGFSVVNGVFQARGSRSGGDFTTTK